MQLVAPVVGEVASGGDRGAFLSGYQKAQQRAEEKKQEDAQIAQRTASAGASYLMDVTKHAEGITDPTDFENFLNMADAAGGPAGYTKPGQLRSTLKFSDAKQTEAQLKELNAQLDQLEKGGYDLDQLAESGSALHLRNGKTLPISTALDIARKRPTDASGAAVPKPKKADISASTDYGRFLSKWAKDRGKTVDQLSAKDELAAKDEFAQAGRAPSDPTGSIEALRQLALNKPPKDEPLAQVTDVDPVTGETVTSLVPRKPGEVARRPAPEPNQSQYQSGEYAGRMEQAESTLTKLESEIAGMNVLSFSAQQKMPAALQSATMQSYMQAARNFINAKLRRESGAAISPTEFSEARAQYLPQPSDTPEVLQQKKATRLYVFENNKRSAGRAYVAPPALGTPGATAKEGDTQPITDAGYPAGAMKTFTGGKWIRTK